MNLIRYFCSPIRYTVVREIFVGKYFRGLGVTTILYYSLLNIFRVINFRGLSQPRKYFNNENFPNYGNRHLKGMCHLSEQVAIFNNRENSHSISIATTLH